VPPAAPGARRASAETGGPRRPGDPEEPRSLGRTSWRAARRHSRAGSARRCVDSQGGVWTSRCRRRHVSIPSQVLIVFLLVDLQERRPELVFHLARLVPRRLLCATRRRDIRPVGEIRAGRRAVRVPAPSLRAGPSGPRCPIPTRAARARRPLEGDVPQHAQGPRGAAPSIPGARSTSRAPCGGARLRGDRHLRG